MDLQSFPRQRMQAFAVRYINSVRCFNIPIVSFAIISVFGCFLAKLTTKYSVLYMKNSLVTIMITNLVLYGISETLAQCILSYDPTASRLSFRPVAEPALSGPDILESQNLGDIGIGDEDEDRDEDRDRDFDGDSLVSDDLEAFLNGAPPQLETPVPPTKFQFSRLAGFMCWGFVMAIVQWIWYAFLQIYSKDPKVVEVIRKVLLDQFCFSPISLFCFFTYGTMVLENRTWDDTKEKLRRVYLSTLMVNYSVWFPVQFINFLLVPRHLQVPFSSSVLVLWNCYLSMRNSAA